MTADDRRDLSGTFDAGWPSTDQASDQFATQTQQPGQGTGFSDELLGFGTGTPEFLSTDSAADVKPLDLGAPIDETPAPAAEPSNDWMLGASEPLFVSTAEEQRFDSTELPSTQAPAGFGAAEAAPAVVGAATSAYAETLTGTFAAQNQLTNDPRIVSLPRVTTSEPPVPNAGRPAISLVHVTKVYPAQPDKPALDDITLDIYTGEFVFLVGHSGSGKSTFIRLLNREIVATKGKIFIGGEDLVTMRNWRIPYLRRNVGCVFQDFKLLPNKTTFENVAFALEVIGKPRAVIRTQVPEVLRLVGLQDKMDKLPDQLSGGEQQRVSIARAMVNRPPYLICDEPTGNLDPQTSLGIMRLLERINRTGTTVVVATHDREMVDSMRRRVIALENGHLVRDQDRGVYGLDG